MNFKKVNLGGVAKPADASDLKSDEETHTGSSPVAPTSHDTSAEEKDWCQDCDDFSEIIVKGYGYCDKHYAIHFCNCKWPYARCSCEECKSRGTNKQMAGGIKVKKVFKL